MNNIILIAVLVILVFMLVVYYSGNSTNLFLGDLTGYSYYQKKVDGNVLMVQYLENDKKKYRVATREDIKLLKRYRFIK